MISLFIKYLQYEKNNSFHTVVAYKEDILQFQNFVNQQVGICDFSKIDSSLVRQWMISLKKKNIQKQALIEKFLPSDLSTNSQRSKALPQTIPYLK